MNKIQILTTHEISEAIWMQIVNGFNASFEDHHTDKEHLINGYIANGLGESYHALCFDNDQLIGFNSIVPNYYSQDLIVGLSGTTFVLKEYRKDIFIFADMFNALKSYCCQKGITVFVGVPNQNSYQYSIKLLQCKDVGLLSYYILPLRISAILNRPKLRFLNSLSLLYSHIVILINIFLGLFWNAKEKFAKYRIKIDDDYLNHRYKDNHYSLMVDANGRAAYTIVCEKSAVIAYIMDFRDGSLKSSRSLLKTVRYILQQGNVDAIMYVGTMNLCQCLLTKVPHCLDPKPLHYTYILTDKKQKEKFADMADLKNWDFSLMNLDVR